MHCCLSIIIWLAAYELSLPKKKEKRTSQDVEKNMMKTHRRHKWPSQMSPEVKNYMDEAYLYCLTAGDIWIPMNSRVVVLTKNSVLYCSNTTSLFKTRIFFFFLLAFDNMGICETL